MRKVAELLLVAAVFEICRRMTKHRLNGRKNHSTRYECCDKNVTKKSYFLNSDFNSEGTFLGL